MRDPDEPGSSGDKDAPWFSSDVGVVHRGDGPVPFEYRSGSRRCQRAAGAEGVGSSGV